MSLWGIVDPLNAWLFHSEVHIAWPPKMCHSQYYLHLAKQGLFCQNSDVLQD